MTEDATPDFLDAFAVNDEDLPGLASLILDAPGLCMEPSGPRSLNRS